MANAIDEDRIRVLIEAERIHQEVTRLAAELEAEYRGKSLTVLGVLKGSVLFLADLIRLLKLPLRLDFLSASSYGAGTVSSGNVVLGELAADLKDRHVLVVDDILDSGRTLHAIAQAVRGHGPASVRTCVLVDKTKERAVEFEADFRAFRIPDVFIVGYGLDYAEQFRNLPYIATVEAEGMAGEAKEGGGQG